MCIIKERASCQKLQNVSSEVAAAIEFESPSLPDVYQTSTKRQIVNHPFSLSIRNGMYININNEIYLDLDGLDERNRADGWITLHQLDIPSKKNPKRSKDIQKKIFQLSTSRFSGSNIYSTIAFRQATKEQGLLQALPSQVS